MFEFLIRRKDKEWFDFPFEEYPEILRPIQTSSKQVTGWGSHRIQVEGEEISFSDEDPGFQVTFESGKLSEERAGQIMEEICKNIESKTGQETRIVRI